jgi:hypothetical protein
VRVLPGLALDVSTVEQQDREQDAVTYVWKAVGWSLVFIAAAAVSRGDYARAMFCLYVGERIIEKERAREER